MKARMPLAWIVHAPFRSNTAGDFVSDFTEKSLSGGKPGLIALGLSLLVLMKALIVSDIQARLKKKLQLVLAARKNKAAELPVKPWRSSCGFD